MKNLIFYCHKNYLLYGTTRVAGLKKEVEAREATEMIKFHQAKNSMSSSFHSLSQTTPTAATLVVSGSPVRCVYYHEAHYLASCTKYQTPLECKGILIKSGRCFNCLRTNHKSRECESLKTSADTVSRNIISLSIIGQVSVNILLTKLMDQLLTMNLAMMTLLSHSTLQICLRPTK